MTRHKILRDAPFKVPTFSFENAVNSEKSHVIYLTLLSIHNQHPFMFLTDFECGDFFSSRT